MTRDQIGSDSPPAAMNDDRLADLVRAAATDWTMPPQRLDHTTWRDRVVVSRPRRARGRVPRLAIPLAGAVAVTVALAFTAVWLDGSRRSAVTGASPSPTGASAATSRPTASDGKAIVNGALPDPASVLVAAGENYRVADLSAGRLGPDVFGRHSGPKTVVARPGGGWLCVCGDWDGSDRSGPPSRLTVTIATAAALGLPQSETTIRQTVGRVDRALPSAAQEELVDGHATISPDGRFAFLGWSVRDGADWKLGIDVIDVAAGRLIGSSGLPNLRSVTDDGQPVTRAAPDVALAPSTGSVLVSDLWFVGGEQEPRRRVSIIGRRRSTDRPSRRWARRARPKPRRVRSWPRGRSTPRRGGWSVPRTERFASIALPSTARWSVRRRCRPSTASRGHSWIRAGRCCTCGARPR